jgi:hypothetical protein
MADILLLRHFNIKIFLIFFISIVLWAYISLFAYVGFDDGSGNLFLKFLAYSSSLLTLPSVELLEALKIKMEGWAMYFAMILLDAMIWAFVIERIITLIKNKKT